LIRGKLGFSAVKSATLNYLFTESDLDYAKRSDGLSEFGYPDDPKQYYASLVPVAWFDL